jgi:hypothetical protein
VVAATRGLDPVEPEPRLVGLAQRCFLQDRSGLRSSSNSSPRATSGRVSSSPRTSPSADGARSSATLSSRPVMIDRLVHPHSPAVIHHRLGMRAWHGIGGDAQKGHIAVTWSDPRVTGGPTAGCAAAAWAPALWRPRASKAEVLSPGRPRALSRPRLHHCRRRGLSSHRHRRSGDQPLCGSYGKEPALPGCGGKGCSRQCQGTTASSSRASTSATVSSGVCSDVSSHRPVPRGVVATAASLSATLKPPRYATLPHWR